MYAEIVFEGKKKGKKRSLFSRPHFGLWLHGGGGGIAAAICHSFYQRLCSDRKRMFTKSLDQCKKSKEEANLLFVLFCAMLGN